MKKFIVALVAMIATSTVSFGQSITTIVVEMQRILMV